MVYLLQALAGIIFLKNYAAYPQMGVYILYICVLFKTIFTYLCKHKLDASAETIVPFSFWIIHLVYWYLKLLCDEILSRKIVFEYIYIYNLGWTFLSQTIIFFFVQWGISIFVLLDLACWWNPHHTLLLQRNSADHINHWDFQDTFGWGRLNDTILGWFSCVFLVDCMHFFSGV